MCENRVGLLLVVVGRESGDGGWGGAHGDPHMFPKIIDMGQETRRDPALFAWGHRLCEPARRQPHAALEGEAFPPGAPVDRARWAGLHSGHRFPKASAPGEGPPMSPT